MYKQIAYSIGKQIEEGLLTRDMLLPSINRYSTRFSVARDTVERAYKELKRSGYVVAVIGKGYYVVNKKQDKLKVLLVLHEINEGNKIMYDVFFKTLERAAQISLQIHHGKLKTLERIIRETAGLYDYYVICPRFTQNIRSQNCLDILQPIPPGKLLLLDRLIPGNNSMSVHQDYEMGIFNALLPALSVLSGYHSISLVFSGNSFHPGEIKSGLASFCKLYHFVFSKITAAELVPRPGTVYVVVDDNDLATLLKKIQCSGWKLGKEVGLISLNDTGLKGLLDITVISTDFRQMGQTAAEMILLKKRCQLKTPLNLIIRNSL